MKKNSYLEKVFIGSRIRDLEYFKRTNTILLALEEIEK